MVVTPGIVVDVVVVEVVDVVVAPGIVVVVVEVVDVVVAPGIVVVVEFVDVVVDFGIVVVVVELVDVVVDLGIVVVVVAFSIGKSKLIDFTDLSFPSGCINTASCLTRSTLIPCIPSN